MKDFQYSNLNIVEINDFIRKDTKQYKDSKNSLCAKAYELETKTIEQDKATVELISDQIKYEDLNYEKMVAELENPNLEGQSFFAKISIKSKNAKALKKLEKEHNNTIMILNNRLKKHKGEYEDHRVMLQHIIDKIEAKGFMWHDVKKLYEEKLFRGVFNADKAKPKKDKEEMEEVPLNPKKKKPKRKTINAGSFYGDPNYYDVSDLTPEQKREWEIMLKKYNYNKEKLRQREIETARMMRMAMMERNQNRNYNNMIFGLSDYALFHGVFRGLHDAPQDLRNAMRRMMIDSGHGLSFIDRNLNGFANEFQRMFGTRDGRSMLDRINCMCGGRYFGEAGLGLFHFDGAHQFGFGDHIHGPHIPGMPGHHHGHHHDRNYLDRLNFRMSRAFHIGENGRRERPFRPCCGNPYDKFRNNGTYECVSEPSHSYLERNGLIDHSHESEHEFMSGCVREHLNENVMENQRQEENELQAMRELSFQKDGPTFNRK